MYYDKKKIYILSATYTLLLFLVSFIPLKLVSNISLSALAVADAVAGFCLIKKSRVRDMRRNEVALVAGLTAIAAVLVLCFLGFHFGFTKHRLSSKTFYTYILPMIVTVMATEIFRGILLAQKPRAARIISYFLCVFTDILLLSEKNPFRSVSRFMSLFAFVFLPAFTSNLLYDCLSAKYGARSVVPYRLVMTLYTYLLPFGVSIPDAMYSFMRILFPLLALWFIKALFDKRVTARAHRHSRVRIVLSVALILLMFVGVAFLANLFRYRPIVVASDSMRDELSRGDVVVYEAYDGQIIQDGQIILFKHNDSIIIHRVVDIKKINGVYRYYTKGDANDGVDTGYITNEDIVGISTMKIKYVGYPTVWLHDIFRK